MKPIDAFSVVVRSIGLLVCLWAGALLFWGMLNLVMGGPASVMGLVIIGAPALVVGLWLLRGAPGIVAFAFPGSADLCREAENPQSSRALSEH